MDINAIKNKLKSFQKPEKGEKKEKIDMNQYVWKPKAEGKYQIRFVPSKFNKEMPFQEVFLHYGFGKFPIWALTNWDEKDPIVEFAKKLKEGDFDKENWQLSNKLQPKLRVYAPIIVRGEEDKGVRLWEFGKEIYQQLLGIAEDEDYGDYTDVSEGRDFTLTAVKEKNSFSGREGLKCTIQIKPKQSPLSKDTKEIKKWLEEQPNILDIQKQFKKSFESLKEILGKYLEPSTEGEEEEMVETENSENKTETKVEDKNDLPWEKEEKSEKSKTKVSSKKSNSKKFDDMFKD